MDQVWVGGDDAPWRLVDRNDDTDDTDDTDRPSHTLPFHPDQLKGWSDLSKAGCSMHEAALVHVLGERFHRNDVYTKFGESVLISVNPYMDLNATSTTANSDTSSNSSNSDSETEADKSEEDITFQLRELAYATFDSMLSMGPKGTPQSILVNGDSGSGKTEASKFIMRCLAAKSFELKQKQREEQAANVDKLLSGMGAQHGGGSSGVSLFGGRGRGRGRGRCRGGRTKQMSNTETIDKSKEITTVASSSETASQTAPSIQTTNSDSDTEAEVSTLASLPPPPPPRQVHESASLVEQCIILANPLLEAFGNAQTEANDNSSRYGKVVTVKYGTDGAILEASASHFFLERSRVVGPASGEFNFHCFYQLLAALESGELQLNNAGSVVDVDELPARNEWMYLENLQQQRKHASSEGTEDEKTDTDTEPDTDTDAQTDDDSEAGGHKTRGSSSTEGSLIGFRATQAAMESLSIDSGHVWRTLLAILLVGQLLLVPDNNASGAGGSGSTIDTVNSPLDLVASLLGVAPGALCRALCSRRVRAGKRASVTTVTMSVKEATQSRDGLAKTLYAALFAWLVEQSNKACSQSLGSITATLSSASAALGVGPVATPPRRKKDLFIAVVDVFGSEVKRGLSGFEQLCISHVNQVLQCRFNKSILQDQSAELAAEGVDMYAALLDPQVRKNLDWEDNQGVELLIGKPSGVFALLDEQVMLGGSDKSFLGQLMRRHEGSKLVKQLGGNGSKGMAKGVSNSDRDEVGLAFEIAHYAGVVQYSCDGFVAKNADVVQIAIVELLAGFTEHVLVKNMLATLMPVAASVATATASVTLDMDSEGGQNAKKNSRALVAPKEGEGEECVHKSGVGQSKMAKLSSASAVLCTQIVQLGELLDATHERYVRCVLPNKRKKAGVWDAAIVARQMRHLGVTRLAHVRDLTLPLRMLHAELLELVPAMLIKGRHNNHVPRWERGVNDKAVCEAILDEARKLVRATRGSKDVCKSDCDMEIVNKWMMGRTFALLPYGGLQLLRECETRVQDRASAAIQAVCRGVLSRQADIHAAEAAKQFAIENSASRIASTFKAHTTRKQYMHMRRAVILMQHVWRFRCALQKRRESAVRIQSNMRRVWACHKSYALQSHQDEHTAATRIQTAYRTASAHIYFLGLRACATYIQAWVRAAIARVGYNRVLCDREPWLDILEPNQAVVHRSLVYKTAESVKLSAALLKRKRKRQLILTSASPKPEIIYVDLAKMQVKGRIAWDDIHLSVCATGEWDFEVGSTPSGPKEKELWVFEDLQQHAAFWVQSLPMAVTVADLVRGYGPRNTIDDLRVCDEPLDGVDGECNGSIGNMVAIQGSMMVKIKKSRKKKANKFEEMYVQLRHKGVLFCYEDDNFDIPFLCLNINADVTVKVVRETVDEEDLVHVSLPTGMDIWLAPRQTHEEQQQGGIQGGQSGLVSRWASQLVKAKRGRNRVSPDGSESKVEAAAMSSTSTSTYSSSSSAQSSNRLSARIKSLIKKPVDEGIDDVDSDEVEEIELDNERSFSNLGGLLNLGSSRSKRSSISTRSSRQRRRSLGPQRRRRTLSRPMTVKEECVAMEQEAELLYSAKDCKAAVGWYAKLLGLIGQDVDRALTSEEESDEEGSDSSDGSSDESDYVDEDDDDDDDDAVDIDLGEFPAGTGATEDNDALAASSTSSRREGKRAKFKKELAMRCWRRLAVCHCTTGDWEAVVNVCRNGIHFEPEHVELYRYCAMAYKALGFLRKGLRMLLDSSSHIKQKESVNERGQEQEQEEHGGESSGDDAESDAIVLLFGELVSELKKKEQSVRESVKSATALMQYNQDAEVVLLLSLQESEKVVVLATVRKGWLLARSQRTNVLGFVPASYLTFV